MNALIIVAIIVIIASGAYLVMSGDKKLTPVSQQVSQPTPDIKLSPSISGHDPVAWWSATDPNMNQGPGRTIDGEIGQIWNPLLSNDQMATTPTSITYDFGKIVKISTIVIKSGIYAPGVEQDWQTVDILVDGVSVLKYSNPKTMKTGVTEAKFGGQPVTYTESNITISKSGRTVMLKFNNSGRIREVQFYGN